MNELTLDELDEIARLGGIRLCELGWIEQGIGFYFLEGSEYWIDYNAIIPCVYPMAKLLQGKQEELFDTAEEALEWIEKQKTLNAWEVAYYDHECRCVDVVASDMEELQVFLDVNNIKKDSILCAKKVMKNDLLEVS